MQDSSPSAIQRVRIKIDGKDEIVDNEQQARGFIATYKNDLVARERMASALSDDGQEELARIVRTERGNTSMEQQYLDPFFAQDVKVPFSKEQEGFISVDPWDLMNLGETAPKRIGQDPARLMLESSLQIPFRESGQHDVEPLGVQGVMYGMSHWSIPTLGSSPRNLSEFLPPADAGLGSFGHAQGSLWGFHGRESQVSLEQEQHYQSLAHVPLYPQSDLSLPAGIASKEQIARLGECLKAVGIQEVDQEVISRVSSEDLNLLVEMMGKYESQDFNGAQGIANQIKGPEAQSIRQRISSKGAELEVVAEKTGNLVAKYVEELNGNETGVYYPATYRKRHSKEWKPEFQEGYTAAPGFERIDFMDWRLLPDRSASEALEAWLKGPTIAECLTALSAAKYKAILDFVGKANFDRHFGSVDGQLAEDQLLRLSANIDAVVPLDRFLRGREDAQAGDTNDRPLKRGDWVYFHNHPYYLRKHPGSPLQGENAIYCGKDKEKRDTFTGLGVNAQTEEEIIKLFIDDYNAPRRKADYIKLLSASREANINNDGNSIPNLKTIDKCTVAELKEIYRKAKDKGLIIEGYVEGQFVDIITADDLKKAGGGIDKSVKVLNPIMVESLGIG